MRTRYTPEDHPASPTAGTLVILTRVEGLLCDRAGCRCLVPRDALRILGACGVPLVFVSNSPAQDVLQLQRDVGVTGPFICEQGAALHLPSEMDHGLVSGEGMWEVFRFTPPGVTTAVVFLRELITARRGREVLMVGLGCDYGDCDLLAAVDVPIVVREHRDQGSLLRRFPGAYVTHATGLDGWSEALLGSPLQ